ncbi:hypothetical protein DFH09DRAFT_1104274 [Mycena vulgaris]|nr:hypothetical protein DFH09DRAFT_1104274 [Mycena vulgaris]
MAVSLNHVDLGPEEPARCTIKFKFSTYFSIKGLNSLNLCSFCYPRSILPVLDPAQCLQETLQLYLAQMWMISTRCKSPVQAPWGPLMNPKTLQDGSALDLGG